MRWAESEASDKAIAEAEEDPIKRNQRLLREDAERKAREREEIRLRILDDKCAYTHCTHIGSRAMHTPNPGARSLPFRLEAAAEVFKRCALL